MLGAAFLGIYAVAPSGPLQLAALYLSEINLILGAFNLLPAFPWMAASPARDCLGHHEKLRQGNPDCVAQRTDLRLHDDHAGNLGDYGA